MSHNRMPTFVLGVMLCILFITMGSQLTVAQVRKVKFSFILQNSAKTSAGVFAADSTLLRTLWSGVDYEAGKHEAMWDGNDDNGNPLQPGSYQVRVLSNNVKYTWDGVIGNTSAKPSGPTVFTGLRPINGLVITGHTAYYNVEYNEGSTTMQRFDTRAPIGKKSILGPGGTGGVMATDDKLVYWAIGGGNKSHFICATRIADDRIHNFSQGRIAPTKYGKDPLSRIDESVLPDFITGLAVQKQGNLLFSVHPNKNTIRVLDKTSGKFIRSDSLYRPRTMALQNDQQAWITYVDNGKYVAALFKIKDDGTLMQTKVRITGFEQPLTIAVSPDQNTVVVADGGKSQQLKAYDTGSGTLKWVFGQQGGYSNDPEVRNDKFYFSDKRIVYNPSIAFEEDGSFWVEDSGNSRLQHFTAERKFINRIMYLPMSYTIAVDINDPTRVFSDYLEFKVDHSKPLQPDNGSWTLVRNWGGSVTEEARFRRWKNMTTLSNGRTYAVTRSKADWVVVELPTKGPLRYTKVVVPRNAGLGADGGLYYMSYVQKGKPVVWARKAAAGFDQENDLLWGRPERLASVPPVIEGDIFSEAEVVNFEPTVMTSTGVLVFFNGRKAFKYTSNPHLGGVKTGGTQWLWQASRGTSNGYSGPFPADGRFDNGNSVKNPGSVARTAGRNIFWGYYGENWKAGQTNKYNHYYDDGLFVGQFGVAGDQVVRGAPAPPMMAGNAMSIQVVRTKNGEVYLYHNDESIHAGVHQWHISDLETIKEQSISIKLR